MYRHDRAFDPLGLETDTTLDSIGCHQLRSGPDKEDHMYNPLTIHRAPAGGARGQHYETFKRIHRASGRRDQAAHAARACWSSRSTSVRLCPLEEVESAEEIVRRFKTGAMSYGSISQEAHECLAVAMNRLGGQVQLRRGRRDARSAWARCTETRRIKQVASGRFGVTSEYLVSAEEIQIKMAQGAKPGEGGHLPGGKVYPWIAKTRHVHARREPDLPAAAPRHLFHRGPGAADLRPEERQPPRAHHRQAGLARRGSGTVAAGVAKAGAQVILISGYGRRHRRCPPHLDPQRRPALGAGPGRGASDADPERTAQPRGASRPTASS